MSLLQCIWTFHALFSCCLLAHTTPMLRATKARGAKNLALPPQLVLFCGRQDVQPAQFYELVQCYVSEATALDHSNKLGRDPVYLELSNLVYRCAIETSILNRSDISRRHAVDSQPHQLSGGQFSESHDLELFNHFRGDSVYPETHQVISR